MSSEGDPTGNPEYGIGRKGDGEKNEELDVAMRTFKGAELYDQPCHGERGGQRQPHDLSAMTARIASVASSMRRIAGSISSR